VSSASTIELGSQSSVIADGVASGHFFIGEDPSVESAENGGGGSGGSIRLTAFGIGGSAVISASGGDGIFQGGGGGGGVIWSELLNTYQPPVQ